MTSNIPRPLRNAPIPLLSDDMCQLSFGERAALEGLLWQLKPRVSIEIGIALGGSLRILSRHSETVHAIDLQLPHERLDNVVYHAGDSVTVLADLLSWPTLAKGAIEFVFVDGDHTYDGVSGDLTRLLTSTACVRSVIVLHDVNNQEVREGVRWAIDGSDRVVYADLDFVAGYTFAEGAFAGERWGGLGLIVVGDQACDGYAGHHEQTLYVGRQ